MFSTVVATGDTAFTTATGDILPEQYAGHDEPMNLEEGSGDSDDVSLPTQNISGRSSEKRKTSSINYPTRSAKKLQKGKAHIGTAHQMLGSIDRLCGAVETLTSSKTEPSHKNYGVVGDEIEGCLNILKDLPGVKVGDELYMFGIRWFMEKTHRLMFIHLPSNDVRLAWLKEELERASS